MLAYHEMIKQFRTLNQLMSEEQMGEYLVEILSNSDKCYNGGSVSKEFQTKLNQMLEHGEIELVKNSKMNNSFGYSGMKPIIFYENQWLYIPNQTLEMIYQKMSLSNTLAGVRNALLTAGWLKTIEDGTTYKITLYAPNYQGKQHVTAVTDAILTEQAKARKLGGTFNFNPCNDDDNHICLGIDEHGRKVCWSISHPDLGNTHLMINGRSGMGKSTAVNLIVRELYAKHERIAYIDFSRSDTPEKLKQSGFDEQFQKKHIIRYSIADCLKDNSSLLRESITISDKIIVFEADQYDKHIETFLSLLYQEVARNSTSRIFLVIDEVHDLDYKKGSALYNIIEKGRGNGISLIGIFQGPHETQGKQFSMMNQAEVKLIFKPSDHNDSQKIAEANSLKPHGEFSIHMDSLRKRHCLVIGNLESEDGELQNSRFIEIEIPNIK